MLCHLAIRWKIGPITLDGHSSASYFKTRGETVVLSEMKDESDLNFNCQVSQEKKVEAASEGGERNLI